jgi:hypothetical protein
MLRAGGTLVLAGTPVSVSASQGPLDIDTDADVELRDMHGDARVRAEGGRLIAIGSSGNLALDGAEVEAAIERIAGRTTIQGDRLRVTARDLKGELAAAVTGSILSVSGLDGPAAVQNDYGDVAIAKAAQAITVRCDQGSVRLTELAGAVQVQSNGPELTVHWIDTSHGQNSKIENAGGDVTVMFSHSGGGHIEARSTGGEVQADLEGVEVSDDGRSAQGNVNNLGRPTVEVIAAGNLFLNQGPRAAGRRPAATDPDPGGHPDQ